MLLNKTFAPEEREKGICVLNWLLVAPGEARLVQLAPLRNLTRSKGQQRSAQLLRAYDAGVSGGRAAGSYEPKISWTTTE